MTSLGLTPFKGALAFEIFANVISLPSLLLKPDSALAMLVKGASEITPAARTLTQWLGGFVAALTIPLILSWPDPKTTTDSQVGFRRATYITMGAGEVVMGSLLAVQYMSGQSGLKDNVLLFLTANMGALLAMRVVFLVYKPEWLEGMKGSGKKTQ